ncbi:MAG: hypothetical protein JXN62_04530 [Bacteroidales bacterium]|nr:hypothetical protein [Bacteroidales bacterium]
MLLAAKLVRLSLSALLSFILLCSHSVVYAGEFELYTPFMRVTVPPGESIDYSIDVVNNTEQTRDVDLSVTGMPSGWIYTLKYGAYAIRRISVLPGDKKSINLKVEVPIKINKGTYRFQVVAGELDVLPLSVTISEQGTFKTEFTSSQANMEGIATSTFNFLTTLKNSTVEKQHYGLTAGAPPGWVVTFRPNYRQATSVDIDANSKVDVSVDIDPSDKAPAGVYKIPVRASTTATSAMLELEVVITGTYGMTLSTPSGLLSTTITAGDSKRIDLVLNNTGSSDLRNISLTSTAPINWEVVFEPDKIDNLEAGKSTQLAVSVKASKKAIAGDYIATLNASSAETSSEVTFRITVKTPMIWGWVGILIIAGALGIVYYLFRKYGRR